MTLFWLCAAFVGGIAMGDWFGLPLVPALIVGGTAALLALLWRTSAAALVFMIVAASAFGAARSAAAQPSTDASTVWSYADQRVTLVGLVAQQPDWSDDRQVVVVAAEQIAFRDGVRAVHGLVRIQLPSVPELRYGHRIRATGTLLSPSAEGRFDFREYLRRHSIHVTMMHPRIVIVGEQRSPLAWLLHLNDHMRATLQRALPEPHAGLLIGMVLGRQNAIDDEVQDNFRTTGTSHLLVISGWNISVLAGTLIGLLQMIGCGRRAAAALTLPVIGLYVLFTGASPAVARAGVMGALVLWAALADREADAWTSLALACAVLALIDPHVLWDIGFQLSFAGTAGLVLLAQPLETWWVQRGAAKHPWKMVLVRSFVPTFAALTLAMPLVVYQFGTAQLIAPVANLMIAPAVPPAMFFGIVAMLVGLVSLPFGHMLGLLVWPFTSWMLALTELFAAAPWASIDIPALDAVWVWLWYALVAAVVWRARSVRVASHSPP